MKRYALSIFALATFTTAAAQEPAEVPEAHLSAPKGRGDVHGAGWSEVLALKGTPLPPRFPTVGDGIERHVLDNGLVVYLAEDRRLPLVSVDFAFRGGEAHETEDERGLVAALCERMRRGGVAERDSAALDARLEEISASLSARGGYESGTLSLEAMSSDLDEPFQLLVEMIRRPRLAPEPESDRRSGGFGGFGGGRGGRGGSQRIGTEFRRLVYGPDHPSGRGGRGPGRGGPPESGAEVSGPGSSRRNRFTEEQLVAAHVRFVRPDQSFLSIVGDFDSAAMKSALEDAFGDWVAPPVEPAAKLEKPEPPIVGAVAGLYVLDTKTPQSSILVGHVGVDRSEPDRFAIDLMNDILGGGSFTSRITERVRNDEGLAYSATSSFPTDGRTKGTFQVSVQTKTESTARAVELILGEIDRMRQPGTISRNEFETALESRLYSFGQQFTDRSRNVARLVGREIQGETRDLDREEYAALTALTPARLEEVARKHLRPESLVLCISGDLAAIRDSLAKFGEIHVIEPRGRGGRPEGERPSDGGGGGSDGSGGDGSGGGG